MVTETEGDCLSLDVMIIVVVVGNGTKEEREREWTGDGFKGNKGGGDFGKLY